jgi:hypothetical protein
MSCGNCGRRTADVRHYCRLCRALARCDASGPAPPGPPAGQEPAAGPEAP